MSRLAIRVSAILLANTVAGWWWLAESRPPVPCARWETDANLDVMPSDTAFSTVIAGSSHGWALTACSDSARVTQDLLREHAQLVETSLRTVAHAVLSRRVLRARQPHRRADLFRGSLGDRVSTMERRRGISLQRTVPDRVHCSGALRNGVNPREIAAALRYQFRPRQPFDAARLTRCERVLDESQSGFGTAAIALLVSRRIRPSVRRAITNRLSRPSSMKRNPRAQRARRSFPQLLLGELPGMDGLRELLSRLERKRDVSLGSICPRQSTTRHLYQDHDHLNAAGTREFIT
jgi:hypothetical protein